MMNLLLGILVLVYFFGLFMETDWLIKDLKSGSYDPCEGKWISKGEIIFTRIMGFILTPVWVLHYLIKGFR